MTHILFATYDGEKHLIIEKPLQIAPNTKVKIIVEVEETVAEKELEVDTGVFGFILSQSQHLGITDWAENHDHYLDSQHF